MDSPLWHTTESKPMKHQEISLHTKLLPNGLSLQYARITSLQTSRITGKSVMLSRLTEEQRRQLQVTEKLK
jgi:hypothetical protein